MEYIPLIVIVVYIIWLIWFAVKASDDLNYCIKEHYKQKLRKDWEQFEEQLKVNRKLDALQWYSIDRPKYKTELLAMGCTGEQVEDYLKSMDLSYKE